MVRLKRFRAAWPVIAVAASLAGAAMAEELQSFAPGARPELMWVHAVGEVDADPDEIDGISVDPAGNTVITGVFRNKVALGDKQMTSRGEGDIFLASIAPDGRYRWSRDIGGEGEDNAFDLKTDAQGNIYVNGWFSGDVDFGGTVLRSAGSTDQFVARYNKAGELIWARNFGGSQGDGGNEIAVLADGSIALTFITEGDATIDGKLYRYGGGERDSIVIRMTPDGDVVWIARANGSGTEQLRAISIAPSGDVYVGFQFQGELRLGDLSLESRGDWDGAMARITPKGEVAWLESVGGPAFDNVRGAGAGPGGTVYISGVLGKGAQIAGREIPRLGTRGDDYIVKLSPEGKPLWLVTMAGPGRSRGAEHVVDQDGLIVSSLAEGPVTIRRNKEKLAVIESPTGRPTSYLAAFDHQGGLRFVYMPSPEGKAAGAFGDVLSVSRDGRYLAQSIRFRDTVSVAGKTLRTPAQMDSAVILFQMRPM